MEAATVSRAPAAAPAAPPAPKKRPRSRPAPGKRTSTRRRTTTARPKTGTRAKAAVAAPVRTAPSRRSPARREPTRRQTPSRNRPAGQLIPIAVGTAARVRHLPDSTLIVRLTSGRAWIAVLGVLLAGIVALNVFTLSLAAGAGQVDENLIALEKDNGIMSNRDAMLSGASNVRHQANEQGLAMADPDEVTPIQPSPDDAAVAAERLAGAAGY